MIVQLVVAMVSAVFLAWLERKIKARSQFRVGPPFMQPVFDLLKLSQKDNTRNFLSSPFINFLPIVSLTSISLIAYSIPMGPFGGGIDVITLIFLFALISVVYVICGFFSYSHYGWFGARRGLVQFFSYELPFVLAILAVAMINHQFNLVNTMNFTPVIIPAAIVFYLSSLAKLRRSPFDIPNASQEIVEGPTTEFSGLSLALMEFTDWMEAFVLSSLFVTLFVGTASFWLQIALTFVVFISMVFIDVLTPRMRINDLVRLFWRVIIPLAIMGVVMAWYFAAL